MKEIKKYFGELFLIIGGFILAETIIRKFLELSNGNIPWWILPLIALVLIFGGMNLKEGKRFSTYEIVYWAWIILSTIFIILVKNKIITDKTFVFSILIISLINTFFFIRSIVKKR